MIVIFSLWVLMSDLQRMDFKNIIVRMPNWIGDLVMSVPVLAELKKRFPSAKITTMVQGLAGELLQADPHIDEVFCFKKTSMFGRRDKRRNIIEKLRRGKYDLGILLTNSFSSAWWFWQGDIKKRLGFFAHGRRFLLTDGMAYPKERSHLVLTYKTLLEPLGIPPSPTPPQLYLFPDEIAKTKQLLATTYGIPLGSPLIGINPGAAYGSAKCWLPERFREVALTMVDKTDATVLFFGDANGVSLTKEICRDLPPRVVNLAGMTSLRELMCLISLCDVLLTNDSGPMHIAAALGTEVVALFGSTDPVVTGPYGGGTVILKQVKCSPCFQRTCPIDFRCMKEITAEEVISTLLKVFHEKRARL